MVLESKGRAVASVIGNVHMGAMPQQSDWIPAFARTGFAGMTAEASAILVPAAPPCVSSDDPWIPAFAGMTVVAATTALSMASCPLPRE